ncbi:MAG: YlxR family protein [Candidatus Eremiobacteraeota bacterium]|nr:YlxR family protein [Candidatus Eremiobacteraeota bacterium]
MPTCFASWRSSNASGWEKAANRSKAPPTRTCVGCRQRKPQQSMQRFVRRGTAWEADVGMRRADGRGAYLCSSECARRVFKNKRYASLASAALVSVFESDYDVQQHHP